MQHHTQLQIASPISPNAITIGYLKRAAIPSRVPTPNATGACTIMSQLYHSHTSGGGTVAQGGTAGGTAGSTATAPT